MKLGKKKAPRVMFLADVHMSNSLPHSVPVEGLEGETDRLGDQRKIWEQAAKIATKMSVDYLVVLGDLFDKSKVDAITLTATTEVVFSFPVPVFILPGNHDAIGVRGEKFTVEAYGVVGSDQVEIFGVKPHIEKNFVLHPIPYSTKDKFEERLKKAKLNRVHGKTNVLLLHQSVEGAEHGGWTCDNGVDPKKLKGKFDLVLAGHFHKRQKFGKNGWYVGSPMQHRFDDIGNTTGGLIVEFREKPVMKFFTLDAPRFLKVKKMDGPEWEEAKDGDYFTYEHSCLHADWEKDRRNIESEMSERLGDKVKWRVVHKPIYHHERRLTIKGDDEVCLDTVEEMVSNYVKNVQKVKGKKRRKKTLDLGMELLSEARRLDGIA